MKRVHRRVRLHNLIMKHRHHIIPRHAGGTDDPSNLIEVTVEEHAELHLARYLELGEAGDWLAYHALSGQASSEWWKLKGSLGGPKGGHSAEAKAAIGKSKIGNKYSAGRRPFEARQRKANYDLRLAWESVEAKLASGKHRWGNKQLSERLGVSRRTLSKISAAIRAGETFEHWSGANLCST